MMTKDEIIETLAMHKTRFECDFGWDTTTIKALEKVIELLKTETNWISVKEKIEKKISEIEAQIPDDIGEHVVGYDKQLGALEAYREMLKEVEE